MGQIEIELPVGAENVTIQYKKIAERNEVVGKDMKDILQENVTYEDEFQATNQHAIITDAEDGVYQIQISGDEGYHFMPIVVSMPAWDQELQKMSYEVEVIPKYSKNMQPPKTGDGNHPMIYVSFIVISFILVAFMSCHKRWKCGKMSFKNSKKRRT